MSGAITTNEFMLLLSHTKPAHAYYRPPEHQKLSMNPVHSHPGVYRIQGGGAESV